MPNNTMGKKENIINETIRKAAKAMGMSFEDSMKKIRDLIDIELKEHASGAVHGHGLDHNHDHAH